MSKKLHLIYKILLIILLYTSTSYADLIKPNNGIEPYQVVKIQLRSLKQNDKPKEDNGIEQTWEFAHPNNQKNTGPLKRFKNMIKGQSYSMLLNHLDHKVVELESTDFNDSEMITLGKGFHIRELSFYEKIYSYQAKKTSLIDNLQSINRYKHKNHT